jgi:hypothetical protein
MLSLKIDALFPPIAAARKLAGKYRRRRPAPPRDDARERKRIADELRKAREELEARTLARRFHIF